MSRAAIYSLVSFSLGLDRPSSKFLLVMFTLVSVSPGLVRATVVTSIQCSPRTAFRASGRASDVPFCLYMAGALLALIVGSTALREVVSL